MNAEMRQTVLQCGVMVNVLILLELLRRRQRRYAPRMWVPVRKRVPALQVDRGHVVLNPVQNMLRSDPETFTKLLGMNRAQFRNLLRMTHTRLTKQFTNMKTPYPAEERLGLTLRYLASGEPQKDLSAALQVSKSGTSKILGETLKVLTEVLPSKYLKHYRDVNWNKISADFRDKYDLPNCIGAIKGIHVVFESSAASASKKHSKTTHYVSVFGVCDIHHRFTHIDIGSDETQSDEDLLKHSEFTAGLASKAFPSPPYKPLPGSGTGFPHYLVAEDLFPLGSHTVYPYADPASHQEQILNDRLSRVTRIVDNAFGILGAKWRILNTSLKTPHAEKASLITLACVCLHNFLMTEELAIEPSERTYCPMELVDRETESGMFVDGTWRVQCENMDNLFDVGAMDSIGDEHSAEMMRDNLAQYLAETDAEDSLHMEESEFYVEGTSRQLAYPFGPPQASYDEPDERASEIVEVQYEEYD